MTLLLLMGLGAASVKAQVRIGGDGAPNRAAVLDLNADDSATPAGNKGALALPRVSLASTTDKLSGATPVTGMLVYNTNVSIAGGNGTGIYYWDGSAWLALAPHTPGFLGQFEIVLDTNYVFTTTAAGFQYKYITAPTLKFGDLCTSNAVISSSADKGALILFFYQATTSTANIHSICYRFI